MQDDINIEPVQENADKDFVLWAHRALLHSGSTPIDRAACLPGNHLLYVDVTYNTWSVSFYAAQ